MATLSAALLAMTGGFVVLRWMPGRPSPVTEPVTEDRSYEAELAILEEQHVLEGSEREG